MSASSMQKSSSSKNNGETRPLVASDAVAVGYGSSSLPDRTPKSQRFSMRNLSTRVSDLIAQHTGTFVVTVLGMLPVWFLSASESINQSFIIH